MFGHLKGDNPMFINKARNTHNLLASKKPKPIKDFFELEWTFEII